MKFIIVPFFFLSAMNLFAQNSFPIDKSKMATDSAELAFESFKNSYLKKAEIRDGVKPNEEELLPQIKSYYKEYSKYLSASKTIGKLSYDVRETSGRKSTHNKSEYLKQQPNMGKGKPIQHSNAKTLPAKKNN